MPRAPAKQKMEAGGGSVGPPRGPPFVGVSIICWGLGQPIRALGQPLLLFVVVVFCFCFWGGVFDHNSGSQSQI